MDIKTEVSYVGAVVVDEQQGDGAVIGLNLMEQSSAVKVWNQARGACVSVHIET